MDISAQFFYKSTMPRLESLMLNILHLGNRFTLEKGHDIYVSDDIAHSFFYIHSGSVSIYHDMPDGKTLHILKLYSGNLIGISGALAYQFTNYRCYEVRYHAHTKVILYKFSGDMVRSPNFIAQYPEIISEILLQQGIKTFMMHNAFTQSNSEAVFRSLCRLFLRLYNENGEKNIVTGISQAELANRFGVHRTTLNRAIHKLKKLGILEASSRTGVMIGDIEKLRFFANTGDN